MMDIRKQTNSKISPQDRQLNYNEIIEYLDSHWDNNFSIKTIERTKQLDQALGNDSHKLNVIMVNGSNGKTLTAYLTAKLLMAENLKVGVFYSPHILTYNERFSINGESISNKLFTEIANEVIATAQKINLQASTYELLTVMALRYFAKNNIDVAIMEINKGGRFNPVNICNAKVATITRIIPSNSILSDEEIKLMIEDMMGIVKSGTWIVSGDQNKSNLQYMNEITDSVNANWAMPIRKLAPLVYPFEQLHGRCAALAERLAQMYIEYFYNKDVSVTNESLLSKPKGQRGRPTLEAKKQSELSPKKTIEQFWREEDIAMPGKFQLLDKEKPSILLDTANNIDALKNFLLGIRLLHYRKPLKGLTIIIGAAKNTLYQPEFLKLIRYFFKKTSGSLIICPIENPLVGNDEEESWDIEKVTQDVRSMKVKVKSCKNFEEAFDAAKKSVDERNGLVAITGSHTIIANYWHNKGIKKL